MRRPWAVWLWTWGPGPMVGDITLSAQPPAPMDPGGRLTPGRASSHAEPSLLHLPQTENFYLRSPVFLSALSSLPFYFVLCLSLSFFFYQFYLTSGLLQRYTKYPETTHYLCKNVLVRLKPPKHETLILTDVINQGSIQFLLTWLRCEVSAVSVTGTLKAENFH